MSIKGALTGLDKIKAKAESKSNNFDGESPFLKIGESQAFKVRFLQEFDDSFEAYDARRGTIVVVEEHTNPNNYKKRAVCSFDEEGKCWGCEQAQLDTEIAKKWRAKMRFYANVIVRGDAGFKDPDKVKILAGGFSKVAIGGNLIEMAVELGSLSTQDLKVSRKGNKLETVYSVFPLPPKALTKDEQKLELMDLGKFIKYVSYEDQATYFTSEEETPAKDEW